MSGWIWESEILSPLKKKPCPAVNFYSSFLLQDSLSVDTVLINVDPKPN